MREKWIDQIQDLAQGFQHVQKIVLFGSRARGDHQKTSDIDLAVFTDGDIVDFIYRLETEVSTLLEFDITVIDDSLDALFLQQIAREGVVIYEKP